MTFIETQLVYKEIVTWDLIFYRDKLNSSKSEASISEFTMVTTEYKIFLGGIKFVNKMGHGGTLL